ncbi:MAG: (Na+)-NQR maturation NqrM [Paracoccus sp. (in: a-proteobacteria)]|nr:(Na+)-NQR maturation NqrM [Paracoccus sp. (in: a-proteobacteria)]
MEFLIAIVIFALAAGGLALGLAFGRPPVQGSCGGIACLPGKPACDDCPNRRERTNP